MFTEQQAQGYLRCYVVWGPTEGSGCGPREDILFTHAKVCDLDVSFSIQHHVIQLEVPGRWEYKWELQKSSVMVSVPCQLDTMHYLQKETLREGIV